MLTPNFITVYDDLGVPWKRGVIFYGPAGMYIVEPLPPLHGRVYS